MGASEQVEGGREGLRGKGLRSKILVLDTGSGNGGRLNAARFPSGSAWALVVAWMSSWEPQPLLGFPETSPHYFAMCGTWAVGPGR